MGLREFGRWVDLSGEGVRKAIKTGRIPPNLVGERAVGAGGRKWPVILDPQAARAALGVNTNEAQQRDRAVLAENRRRVAHGQPKLPTAGTAGVDPAEDMPAAGVGKAGGQAGKRDVPTQAESNAIAAAYKARMAKLEYEERVGKLVSAAEIKAGIVGLITAAKTKILGVPSKAKSRIPTLSVGDLEILEELLAEAMEELSAGE